MATEKALKRDIKAAWRAVKTVRRERLKLSAAGELAETSALFAKIAKEFEALAANVSQLEANPPKGKSKAKSKKRAPKKRAKSKKRGDQAN